MNPQDDAHTRTPRSNARRNERDARTLDTPERRRIPAGPRLDPLPQPFPVPAPPIPVGSVQNNDPFQNNYAPAPVYHHLPAHLALAVAQLPSLQPVNRGRGRGRNHSIPAYQNFPPHLAEAVAQLPPLQPVRGQYQNINWAPIQMQPAILPVHIPAPPVSL
jgi:hypothetical protein